MNKLILLATIVAFVVADGTIHQLTLLGGSYTGSLVTDYYARFYIDYPENTSQIALTLTGTTIAGQDCDYLYITASPLGYPCSSYYNEPSNVDSDPCSTYGSDYIDPTSTGETETFYIYPGMYDNGILDDSSIYHQSGRLFLTIYKEYTSDQCGYTIQSSATACPSALGANNGIAVGYTYDYLLTENVNTLRCDVYSNLTLIAGQAVYTQINNISNTNNAEVIYKSTVPKNAAYINFTLNGTVYFQDDYDYLYLIASPYVTVNETYSDLDCYTSVDNFDSTTHYGTVSLTCQNVPAGDMYILLIFEDTESTTYFHGTLSANLVVCPDGTATGYYDYYNGENYDDQSLNCSSAYYFNTSSLLNPLIGSVNFTNVPSDTWMTGYFDFSQLNAVGGSFTLNNTGCGTAKNCEYDIYVGLYMNSGNDGNNYEVDEAYEGFSLSAYDTDATGFFNITNQRFYISYYCETGPCTTEIFVNRVFAPVTSGISAQVTTSKLTSGVPVIYSTTGSVVTGNITWSGVAGYIDGNCSTIAQVVVQPFQTDANNNCGANSPLAAGVCTAADSDTLGSLKQICFTSLTAVQSYAATLGANTIQIIGYGDAACAAGDINAIEYLVTGVCEVAEGQSVTFACTSTTFTATQYSGTTCKGTGQTVAFTTCSADTCCTETDDQGNVNDIAKYTCINTGTSTATSTASSSTATSTSKSSTGVRMTSGVTGTMTGNHTTSNTTTTMSTTAHISSSDMLKIGFFALALGFLFN